MYLGVQGLMPRNLNEVTEATMTNIRDHGFNGAACRYFEPLETTESDAKRLREIMNVGGVNPCQTAAQHPDLIDPDPDKRAKGVWAMRLMCKVARWLGGDNLYVRSGSLHLMARGMPTPTTTNLRHSRRWSTVSKGCAKRQNLKARC